MRVATTFEQLAIISLSLGLTLCSACTGQAEAPPSSTSTATDSASSSAPAGEALAEPGRDARAVADDVRHAADAAVDAGLPGAVVLVRRGDRSVVVAEGHASLPPHELSGRHAFQVGSVTKPMVATVVMSLVDDGTLRLDDTVERWLPGLLPQGKRITVEALLSHTSGLFNYTDARFRLDRTWRPREVVALSTAHKLQFPPGSVQEYSNTNYIVLGLLAEQVSGQSLESLLTRRVFEPAGMTSTRLRPTYHGPVHGYEQGRDATLRDLTIAWSAGGAVSTAADLDRFLRALLGGDLVSASALGQMMTTRDELPGSLAGYGLGLATQHTRCGVAYGHGGEIPGFRTEAWASEDLTRGAIVMVNASDMGAPTGPLLDVALCG